MKKKNIRKKFLIIIVLIICSFVFLSDKVYVNQNSYKANNTQLEKEKSDNLLLTTVYPMILLIISVIYTKDSKKILENKKINITNEKVYYPPKDYNPIEIEKLFKGKVEVKTIIATILQLANRGYIKIEEYWEKTSSSEFKELELNTKKIKLTKGKEYDETNQIESKLLDYILINKEETEFYKLPRGIKFLYKELNKDHKEISKKNLKKLYINFITILVLLTLPSSPIFIILLLPYILSIYFLNSILSNTVYIDSVEKTIITPLVFIMVIIFSFGWSLLTKNLINISLVFKIAYFISIICLFILEVIIVKLPSKVDNSETKVEIENYKKTLEELDTEKIEILLRDDENYFYKTLPYTYVFNIEKEFISNFGSYIEDNPKFFITDEEYTKYEINNEIDNFINDLNDFTINHSVL